MRSSFFELVLGVIRFPSHQASTLLDRARRDPDINLNEGQFLLGWSFLTYPAMYLASTQLVVANILFPMTLGFLYWLNPSTFIDADATAAASGNVLVPKEGLPMWWAHYYAVIELLWLNYDYMEADWQPEVAYYQFWAVSTYAFTQLLTLPVTFLPMVGMTFSSLFGFVLLYLYELHLFG